MLMGHYGASLQVRRVDPALPVSLIFVAAQVLDIIWCVLVLFGIERLRIVPGITATNGLDLQWIPWSHSLPAAILWGAITLAVCRRGFRFSWSSAVLLAGLVSGHWFLDLLVHRPDLPVWRGWPNVGLGLWNHAIPAFLLEAGLLLSGGLLYLRQSTARSLVGQYGVPALGVVMCGIQLVVFFSHLQMSAQATVCWALFGYIALPAVAGALETQRAPGKLMRPAGLPWIARPQRRRDASRWFSAKD